MRCSDIGPATLLHGWQSARREMAVVETVRRAPLALYGGPRGDRRANTNQARCFWAADALRSIARTDGIQRAYLLCHLRCDL